MRKGEAAEDRFALLCEQIEKHYGSGDARRILDGLHADRKSSFRINRLRTGRESVEKRLGEIGASYREVEWFKDAFVTDRDGLAKLREDPLYANGEVYVQNLSSMIPPLMTEISAGEDILDMCAAPGGKTTQIMSLSGGKVNLTACEKDRVRAERLRYNLSKQGCSSVNLLVTDALKLDSFMRFDRIFLDAPCSGSGTALAGDPSSYRGFSTELAVNSARLQLKLLKKGLSLLKSGGILVYSTCSVLPGENQDVIRQALAGGTAELLPPPEALRALPLLDCSLPEALLVCPGEEHEGFFAVMMRRR